MGDIKCVGVSPIGETSIYSDKSGQTPLRAKWYLWFKNAETGKSFSTTDLYLRKKKRGNNLELFKEVYLPLFKQKAVTVFLVVVEKSKYENISSFLSDFKRKLSRKGIPVLGYVWQQDIGYVRFEKHYHVMLVTPRLDKHLIKNLRKQKRNKIGYKFEFCDSILDFKGYLQVKELYAENGKRAYGRSNKFKHP